MSIVSNYTPTNQPIKDDRAIITSFRGKFLGVYDVPLSDMVYGNRYQPARSSGEDRELRRQLVSDIRRRQMRRAPTVTWDSSLQKFRPNDGNHRLQAHEEIAGQQDLSTYFVPVAVVDWGTNVIGEIEYSHNANNHEPAKAGTKKDAILMLEQLNAQGVFRGLNDKARRKKIYKLIDDNFSSCCSPSSKANILKNFRLRIGQTKITQFTKRQLTQESLAHWNLPGKKFRSGHHVIGKTSFICSVPTAADKAIHRAAVNVVANKSAGTEVKLLCYSNASKISSIEKERDKVLREYACCNRSLWKKGFVVSEISFLPQVQKGANMLEPKQIFLWKPDPNDNNKEKWHDLRNNSFRTD